MHRRHGPTCSSPYAPTPAPGTLHRPGHKARHRTGSGHDPVRPRDIDLAAVSQLVDAAQTQAIAHALDRLAELLDQPGPDGCPLSLEQAITALCDRSMPRGWMCSHPTAVTPGIWHDPARSSCTRPVNRYRGLRLETGPAVPERASSVPVGRIRVGLNPTREVLAPCAPRNSSSITLATGMPSLTR